VLRSTPTSGVKPERGLPGVGTERPLTQVRVLLITERVNGFFLERITERGKLVRDTQHETLDEAMRQAYDEFDMISEWRFCPDGANPLDYIGGKTDL
jgi:hypothetical protein